MSCDIFIFASIRMASALRFVSDIVCVNVAVHILHIQYGLLALSNLVCKMNLWPYL